MLHVDNLLFYWGQCGRQFLGWHQLQNSLQNRIQDVTGPGQVSLAMLVLLSIKTGNGGTANLELSKCNKILTLHGSWILKDITSYRTYNTNIHLVRLQESGIDLLI